MDKDLVIFILFILLWLMAIFYEIRDIQLVRKKKSVDQFPNEERQREYEFYGCYMYENNIIWRMLFIQTLIAVAIVYVIQPVVITPMQCMYLFFIIFLVSYFASNFKVFHFYRVMASKVKPSIDIM